MIRQARRMSLLLAALAASLAGGRARAQGCGTIVLSPATLPRALEQSAYGATITASGGTAPYTFAVTAGALPPGITLSPSGVLSGTPPAPASSSFTVTATDAATCTGSRGYTMVVDARTDYLVGASLVASSPPRVKVWSGVPAATPVDFLAYGAGQYGVNVAGADVRGDAHDTMLTGPGPGAIYGPQVRGWDRTGAAIAKLNFYAYGTLKYGANVAGGELDGDGFDEILTAPGPGTVFGPHVRGFQYDNAAVAAMSKVSFFAYATLKYGAKVAGGDIDGDGFSEMVTAPGPSLAFSAQVRAFNYDGAVVASITKVNFVAYAGSFYGANIAAADVDDDLFGEILTGPGPDATAGPRFLGFNYDGLSIAPLPGYDVVAFATGYGGRVGGGDVRHDGRADLLCGAGPDPSADSSVATYAYDGAALTLLPPSFAALPGTTSGVNVVGAALGY